MADPEVSWLDEFFGPPTIADEVTALPKRTKIAFQGARVVATDDPINKQTIITIDGANTLGNAGTGALNDVATTISGAPASAVRFSGAAPVVSGFASGTDARFLPLATTGGNLVIKHESNLSAAANRVITPTGADVTLNDESIAFLVYFSTESRWRLAVASSGAGTGEANTSSNSGTGAQVAQTKSGVNLPFRSFLGGPSTVVTQNTDDITVDADGVAPILNSATGSINDLASQVSGKNAALIRFSGAAPTLTGLTNGADKRRPLVLHTTGGPLVLAHESASSTAINRIVTSTAADVTVPQGAAALLSYDETASRWRLVGVGVVPGVGGSFTAGGDLTGTNTNQTVAKIKGTTITTVGGALAVGAVLRTTAVGTADWGAVDLADTDAVTGLLPIANISGSGATALQFLQRNSGNTGNQWATVTIVSSAGSSGEVQTTNGSGGFTAATGVKAGSGGNGFISFGTSPATSGNIRVPNGAQNIVTGVLASTATGVIVATSVGDEVDFGSSAWSTVTVKGQLVSFWGNTANGVQIASGSGGANSIKADGTSVQMGLPVLGWATPYGNDGQAVVVVTASATLTSSQYNHKILKFTGTHAATDTITFPHPADDDHSYTKFIRKITTTTDIVWSTGTGNVINGWGTGSYDAILHFTPTGVSGIKFSGSACTDSLGT
jgi:hypothetical protein